MRLSVVVPTLNESGNAQELLRRLTAVLAPDDEILFVDDGDDDLPIVIAQQSALYTQSISVHRRSGLARVGGLGGAVTKGLRLAVGEAVIVCDGDLQHPPEAIPAMVAELSDNDVVVASRYCAEGSAAGLDGGWRRAASRATGAVSRVLFPLKLKACSDPMSGFFALRQSAVNVDDLRPRGFKILLEMLVRSPKLRVSEIPFAFAQREAGVSHATYGEGVRFLRQLLSARLMNKATAFMAVGLSGVLPNLLVLWLLTGAGMHYVLAAVLATQAAILWNFGGAELLVWRDHRLGDWRHRFAKFILIGETDLARLPFVILLVSFLHFSSLAATGLTLIGAFACRFTLADKLVYRRAAPITAPEHEAGAVATATIGAAAPPTTSPALTSTVTVAPTARP